MDKIKKTVIDIDDLTKAKIVEMILEKQTEKALEKLSEFYHVTSPQIVVGTIKGKRRTVYALYVQKERKIYALNSEIFLQSFCGFARVLPSHTNKAWSASWFRKECK